MPETASGRTAPGHELDTVSFGPFSLRTRLLEKDGVPVKLGGRATDILRLLVNRAGEVIPKGEILAYAWSGLVVEEISLRVHIAELRKALGDGKEGARYITNVPSRGYCFVAPVRVACRRRRYHRRSSRKEPRWSRCHTAWSGWSDARTFCRNCRLACLATASLHLEAPVGSARRPSLSRWRMTCRRRSMAMCIFSISVL
jgi:DNA-binding winged helix-turn-helix (wHTH) protein